MENRITVFTCCNGIYKEFIPLFILSNLINISDSFVEVGVDIDDISELKIIKFLEKKFPNRFTIRLVNFGSYDVGGQKLVPMPNLVRFITEPITKSKYVYISDVDIITLDKNIVEQHEKNILLNCLPYSNIVRDYTESQKHKRLTGLHFSRFDSYYPIKNYENICKMGLFSHDEMFLYQLMYERHGKPDEKSKWRPVHGIHVSPNRKPDGEISWGMERWENQWKKFRNMDIFIEIEPLFSDYLKDKIEIIDNFYK